MNAYFYKAGAQIIKTAVNHPELFSSNFSKPHRSRMATWMDFARNRSSHTWIL